MSSRRKEKLMGEQPSATPDPAITPADSLAAPADSLTDLRGQMTVMKGEIDALKIASAQAGKPWYRQASVIIAVAALLFSMVSTYYADHLTTEQSKVASRSELGQLIQLLSALPEKDTELAAKYAGAPTTMISLRGISQPRAWSSLSTRPTSSTASRIRSRSLSISRLPIRWFRAAYTRAPGP
jgi:hypothetical protein